MAVVVVLNLPWSFLQVFGSSNSSSGVLASVSHHRQSAFSMHLCRGEAEQTEGFSGEEQSSFDGLWSNSEEGDWNEGAAETEQETLDQGVRSGDHHCWNGNWRQWPWKMSDVKASSDSVLVKGRCVEHQQHPCLCMKHSVNRTKTHWPVLGLSFKHTWICCRISTFAAFIINLHLRNRS